MSNLLELLESESKQLTSQIAEITAHRDAINEAIKSIAANRSVVRRPFQMSTEAYKPRKKNKRSKVA